MLFTLVAVSFLQELLANLCVFDVLDTFRLEQQRLCGELLIGVEDNIAHDLRNIFDRFP